MEIRVHPRVCANHPEIADEDAIAAFHSTLRSAPRVGSGFPPQWLGVGFDSHGRLLQYLAVNTAHDDWLIFHAMEATTKVLRELGLRR